MPAAHTDPDAVYFPIADVARVLKWRVERTRRWLRREGALVRKGRYYYVTKPLLRAAFPEAWDDVCARLFE